MSSSTDTSCVIFAPFMIFIRRIINWSMVCLCYQGYFVVIVIIILDSCSCMADHHLVFIICLLFSLLAIIYTYHMHHHSCTFSWVELRSAPSLFGTDSRFPSCKKCFESLHGSFGSKSHPTNGMDVYRLWLRILVWLRLWVRTVIPF